MKKALQIIFVLLCLIPGSTLSAQLSVLFVDDSDDGYSNSETLQDALSNNGVSFDLYDAQGTETSPTAAEMSGYDLVIWHTSSQGLDLYIWNGSDMDNPEITAYLDQGGNMMLIGNDFFFDRYGAFVDPVDFVAGDFAYDYMGIDSWDEESYATDGELGVPFMRPVMDQPIPGLGDVSFIFSTLWYADGVTPRAETVPLYEFGGDGSYVLEGTVSGTWYDSGSFVFITLFFDMALSGNLPDDGAYLKAIIDFLEANTVSTTELAADILQARAFPNPASDRVEVLFDLPTASPVELRISDATGRLIDVLQSDRSAGQQNIEWDIPAGLANGFYLLSLQTDHGTQNLKVLVQ